MALYRHDTIAAISTPVGEGGIGIVRLSGSDAIPILQQLFRPFRNGGYPSHRFVFGEIVDPLTGERIDEALAVVMRAPHSYTREDVVELQCHGGYLLVQRVVQLTIAQGARLAEPGEFTRRAFLNGRIDLVQAEAVIDVIRAKTDAALALAQRQREGELSQRLFGLRDDLRHALALVEAYLDFPDEELDGASQVEIVRRTRAAAAVVAELIAGFAAGRVLREGVAVSIIGRPNVGKSSLLNALLQEKRAIVTSVPGTTRDVIEEVLNLEGLPVRLLDTAGIRETDDLIEQEGVRRSLAKIAESDLVLFLVDGSLPFTAADAAILPELTDKRMLVVVTKKDLPPALTLPADLTAPMVPVSTLTGVGMAELRHAIHEAFLSGWAEDSRDRVALSQVRQRDALARCGAALDRVAGGLQSGADLELVAADLRDGLQAVGEVTGETTPDDVLDLIFDRFCIGK